MEKKRVLRWWLKEAVFWKVIPGISGIQGKRAETRRPMDSRGKRRRRGGGGEKNTNKGITTRRKEMWGLAMEDFEDKQKVLYWIQEQSSVDIYRLQRKRTIALQKEGGEKELISFISFKFIHNHI